MMRIALFVVALVLVCVPLVWLQAESGDPTVILSDQGLEVKAVDGAAFDQETLEALQEMLRDRGWTSRQRLEGLTRPPVQRRLRPCLAQAPPDEPRPEAQAPAPAPAPGTAGPAGTAIDPCDVGYEISRMNPCTSAADCPAHELWSSALGAPGPRSAGPERR